MRHGVTPVARSRRSTRKPISKPADNRQSAISQGGDTDQGARMQRNQWQRHQTLSCSSLPSEDGKSMYAPIIYVQMAGEKWCLLRTEHVGYRAHYYLSSKPEGTCRGEYSFRLSSVVKRTGVWYALFLKLYSLLFLIPSFHFNAQLVKFL